MIIRYAADGHIHLKEVYIRHTGMELPAFCGRQRADLHAYREPAVKGPFRILGLILHGAYRRTAGNKQRFRSLKIHVDEPLDRRRDVFRARGQERKFIQHKYGLLFFAEFSQTAQSSEHILKSSRIISGNIFDRRTDYIEIHTFRTLHELNVYCPFSFTEFSYQ
jgi:hypothetical protein